MSLILSGTWRCKIDSGRHLVSVLGIISSFIFSGPMAHPILYTLLILILALNYLPQRHLSRVRIAPPLDASTSLPKWAGDAPSVNAPRPHRHPHSKAWLEVLDAP